MVVESFRNSSTLAQVREEQERVRPDASAPINAEVLNQLTYTRQVVKEILRYRPPAPMVPQVSSMRALMSSEWRRIVRSNFRLDIRQVASNWRMISNPYNLF